MVSTEVNANSVSEFEGDIHKIPEEVVSENLEKKRDEYLRETIKELLYSNEGRKILEYLSTSRDSVVLSKILPFFQMIRDLLAEKQGYDKKDSKYISSTGLDMTSNMLESYPDKSIARLLIEHIDRLGSDAPEGSNQLKEFLSK